MASKSSKKSVTARKEPEVEVTVTEESTPEKAEKVPAEPKAPRVKKEKPVREVPAHMAKVARFEKTLPSMNEDTQAVFTAASQLSTGDLSILAAWINLEARKRTTSSAASSKLSTGDRVRIVSGTPRYIGKEGVITKAQRIRCFVKVEGVRKDVYLFSSDVEVIGVTKLDISEPEAENTSEEATAAVG